MRWTGRSLMVSGRTGVRFPAAARWAKGLEVGPEMCVSVCVLVCIYVWVCQSEREREWECFEIGLFSQCCGWKDPPWVSNRGLIVQRREGAGCTRSAWVEGRTNCFSKSHTVTGGRESPVILCAYLPFKQKPSKTENPYVNKHRTYPFFENITAKSS